MTKRIVVKGAVQGVGYRPFIAEKAEQLNIKGYVKNTGASVEIIAQGDESQIDAFIFDIKNEVPPGAFIVSLEVSDCTSLSFESFEITQSSEIDLSSEIPVFLPDIGICDSCMEEMLDPEDRRYRYPLISCAVCGPRISILNYLPYDRHSTTMKEFHMCDTCSGEYKRGRRRYAQTISCHDCGPQMLFKYNSKSGSSNTDIPREKTITETEAQTQMIGEDAVREAANVIKNGGIIGLKGISGYQLVCMPKADAALRLRKVKGRENKPFAILYATIDDIRNDAVVSPLEEELLLSSARPIVLLKKRTDYPEEVVKSSLYIGAFLPSSGIHRLLCDACGPLIVTSANISDAPMIIEDRDFYDTFFEAVDGMCYHKRQINMAQDDSVMFVIDSGEGETAQFIRRARGFVPLPIFVNNPGLRAGGAGTVFAAGGDLKNTFAFGKKDRILPSQYIGDLGDEATNRNHVSLCESYNKIFYLKPDVIVSDLHPGYFSSRRADAYARELDIPSIKLQHHFAHVYSVMAENSLESAIGVSFDGTGYGTDGKIWGGEFLYCRGADMTRMGHLSYVKLVGGDTASKNAADVCSCYRIAAKKHELKEIVNDIKNIDNEKELARLDILSKALINNINTFECSSMGRLFDAVAALLGISSYNSYEGECAILLENEASEFIRSNKDNPDFPEFKFRLLENVGTPLSGKQDVSHDKNEAIDSDDAQIIADQLELFSQIMEEVITGRYSSGAISYGFHMAVSQLVSDVCCLIRDQRNENKVCLSGGCFNNRILLTNTIKRLRNQGLEVFWNQKLPLGDGSISVGQAYYGRLLFM